MNKKVLAEVEEVLKMKEFDTFFEAIDGSYKKLYGVTVSDKQLEDAKAEVQEMKEKGFITDETGISIIEEVIISKNNCYVTIVFSNIESSLEHIGAVPSKTILFWDELVAVFEYQLSEVLTSECGYVFEAILEYMAKNEEYFLEETTNDGFTVEVHKYVFYGLWCELAEIAGEYVPDSVRRLYKTFLNSTGLEVDDAEMERIKGEYVEIHMGQKF